MPRRAEPDTAETRALNELEAEDDAILTSLARQAGSPGDARRLSEAQEDEAYAYEDRFVAENHDMLASQLMTEGLPSEVAQQMLVFKLRPDWLEAFAKPTQDAETADQWLKAAKNPFRWNLLEDYDDPDEMVKAADRLESRHQRRQTRLQDDAAAISVLPGMKGA